MWDRLEGAVFLKLKLLRKCQSGPIRGFAQYRDYSHAGVALVGTNRDNPERTRGAKNDTRDRGAQSGAVLRHRNLCARVAAGFAAAPEIVCAPDGVPRVSERADPHRKIQRHGIPAAV